MIELSRRGKGGQHFQFSDFSLDPIPLYCDILETYLFYFLPLLSRSNPALEALLNPVSGAPPGSGSPLTPHSLTNTIYTNFHLKSLLGSLEALSLLATQMADTVTSLIVSHWILPHVPQPVRPSQP